jgi:hypothetical protein
MRETCARVLAAALMTGAVAFAVAMPALIGVEREPGGRALTAPPSSLRRSVPMVAAAPAAPLRRPGSVQLVDVQSVSSTARVAVARPGSTRTAPSAQLQPAGAGRSTGVPRPAPAPAPQPAPTPPATETRTLASTPPPVAEPAPADDESVEDEVQDEDNGKKGRGKDHDKQRGNANQSEEQCPPEALAVVPRAASPEPSGDQGDDRGEGHGNGKGSDKERGH